MFLRKGSSLAASSTASSALEEVPEGYRAMNDREAIKVMVQP
jgi:threonine dehydrogenase-like Zn-dependent dehydrogenase